MRLSRSLCRLLVVVLAATVWPDVARAQGPAVPGLNGIGVEESFSAPSGLTRVLAETPTVGDGVPLFVRLAVSFADLRAAEADGDWSRWDARLEDYAARGVRVLVAIEATSFDADAGAEWRRVVRAVAERSRNRVAAYQIGWRASGVPTPDVQTYAFFLKLAAVQIRAADAEARIAPASVAADDAAWLKALYGQDTEAYLDLVVVVAPVGSSTALATPGPGRGEGPFEAVRAVVEAVDPGAGLVVSGVSLPETPDDAARRWFSLALAGLGGPLATKTFRVEVASLPTVLTVAGRIADVLSGDVVVLDAQEASVHITVGGRDVTAETPFRLLYNLSTLARYFVYQFPTTASLVAEPLVVTLEDRFGHVPVRRDPAGNRVEPIEFTWDEAGHRTEMKLPSSPTAQLVDFDFGADRGTVVNERVAGAALPSVSEVVFREQQVRAVQDGRFENYIAVARLAQHFRPSPTDVFDVVSTNRFFVDRGTTEWEELTFTINGTAWGPDRPAFPLLQAEKVLSLPLDVRLTSDYSYRLDGIEQLEDCACYVVRFDPVDYGESLYRGTIWIDAETYRRVQVRTIQTRMAAPVVSSEEIQHYEEVRTPDGETLNLVTRVSTKQIFLIAGRNLLMEKEAIFSDFEVDAPDFELQRRAAHDSDRIMFRDTDEGVRYLVKEAGQRVVSDGQTTSAKALAMGTTVDPSFDFPLPIFGLNYLDFDFLGKNSQLALLYGGVLALANVQFPRLGGSPIDVSADVFAIAVPSNDVLFGDEGERVSERLLRVPFSTGLNVGYQFTPFQRLTASYTFNYDIFFADTDTAADFIVPVDTATHGVGLSYEYSRRGYTISAAASALKRSSWMAWGYDALDPSARDYRRHSLTASKDFFPAPFHSIHVEGAWYGGRDLDRFSMYQFGLFDAVRMHGVPAAGVRFRELALTRVSYSFNVFDQFRFDLFLDQAAGRDPDSGSQWHPVTGTGVALSTRAPWRTLLRVDVGKGFLPERYKGAGSFVLQVLLLKPL